MYSQSLLSYSISIPHKRDLLLALILPIVLPPIHNFHSSLNKPRQQVMHPKISSVYQSPSTSSSSAFASSKSFMTMMPSNASPNTTTGTFGKGVHPYTQPLTEHNLNLSNNYSTGIPSPPKSILLVALELPVLLPTVTKAELQHQHQPASASRSSSTTSITCPAYNQDDEEMSKLGNLQQQQQEVATSILGKKRRQRLGPSCDSCRQRKVKCNAEIVILLTNPVEFQKAYQQLILLTEDETALLAGKAIKIEADVRLVIQNEKLVKFRLCKLCDAKNLNCCFLKGFTKEDIVNLAKKNHTKEDLNRVSKPVASNLTKIERSIKNQPKKPLKFDPNLNRKSSCTLCRQRKVKCLFSETLGKCENCHRKNKSCLFDC